MARSPDRQINFSPVTIRTDARTSRHQTRIKQFLLQFTWFQLYTYAINFCFSSLFLADTFYKHYLWIFISQKFGLIYCNGFGSLSLFFFSSDARYLQSKNGSAQKKLWSPISRTVSARFSTSENWQQ